MIVAESDQHLTIQLSTGLLERLADPCPSVSAAAAAAIGSFCVHCGYPSFDELVHPRTIPCIMRVKACFA